MSKYQQTNYIGKGYQNYKSPNYFGTGIKLLLHSHYSLFINVLHHDKWYSCDRVSPHDYHLFKIIIHQNLQHSQGRYIQQLQFYFLWKIWNIESHPEQNHT